MPVCAECGMPVDKATTYHPYAACLMFKACHSSDVVQANINAVVAHGVAAERERCASLCDAYAAERHALDEPGDEKRIQGHKAVTAHVLANRIRGA